MGYLAHNAARNVFKRVKEFSSGWCAFIGTRVLLYYTHTVRTQRTLTVYVAPCSLPPLPTLPPPLIDAWHSKGEGTGRAGSWWWEVING